ncbi:MAG: NADH-quinone oxidoreductase subunit N [Deltaproteobacteria bacterium]|nr:NADH-quinone oxidoreductase subunit N [Deltaproteobacteria bacterium]
MAEIEQNFSFSQLWHLGYPTLILVIAAFTALMTSIMRFKRSFLVTSIVSALGFFLSALGTIFQIKAEVKGLFFGLEFGLYGQVLALIIALIGLVVVLFSYRYWLDYEQEGKKEIIPETMALMLFSAVGMQLMLFAQNWIIFVLSLEVMSIALYILVGIRRYQVNSAEGALKYFLLGSVAAAIMLMGISFLYGATGSLDMMSFLKAFSLLKLPTYSAGILVKAGLLLVLIGFIFKIAAVPFHFWAPDVYEAAPMPVTGFMATGVKVAAFGAFFRILMGIPYISFDAEHNRLLLNFLGLIFILTVVVANMTALRQKSIKRVLAYSSIAHAGYLLLGVMSYIKHQGQGSSHELEQIKTMFGSLQSILLYLAVYSLLTLGAFAVLTNLSKKKDLENIEELKGLAGRQPLLAAALSVFLFALAGIPPLGGFFAKYYLFSQAIATELYLYAVIGILFSAVSLYYYLAPVVAMYFMKTEASQEQVQSEISTPFYSKLLIVGMMVLVFYVGLFPQSVLDLF